MGKDIKKSNKPAKWAALATYVIALLCLLAGLLVPLAPLPLKGNFGLDNMLIMQAFAAIGTFGLKIPFAPAEFVYSYASDVKLFGVIPAFDLGAALVLLYVLVCVIALIGLIPVIASNRNSRTALRTACFVEILGAVAASLFVLIQLGQITVGATAWKAWAFAPVIALGGCVLTLFIQSVAYRKGSGIIKFFLLLLSSAAVLFTVFNILEQQLGGIIGKLPAFINNYSLYTTANGAVFGASLISDLFVGSFSTMFTGALLEKILTGVTLALSLFVVINFILDLMGLGKTTNKFMLIANLVRYILQLILVVVLVVFTFVIKDVTLGFFGYVLAVIALLQFIINLIRLIAYKPAKKTKKAAKPAVKEENAEAKETDGEAAAVVVKEEKVDKKAEKRAAKEAKKAEKEAAKKAKNGVVEDEETAAAESTPIVQKNPDPSVYTVEPIYDGPIDEFIKKLTNSERIEFAHCFLEKNLVLPNVPDYVVGGNNGKFFSSVFIYYARICDRVSHGLINKLYEQGNIME